jgi:RNA polymerase sigma factor (sigma-70 family)
MRGAGEPGGSEGTPSLSVLLESHRESLLRLVRREARGLLSYEGVDDLVQGVHLRALEVGERFVYQGEKAFLGWLFTLARRHFADRADYWSALKRRGPALLRLTTADPSVSRRDRGRLPAVSGPGPATRASEKEEIALVLRAVSLLLPRDQKILHWLSEGIDLEETAARLGLSYDAAERARLRAADRLRKAFSIVSPRRGPGRSRANQPPGPATT